MKKPTWTENQFKEAVSNSKCITDVSRFLKLGIRGSNYKTIRYWIEKFKLDTSHFVASQQLQKDRSGKPKWTIETALIENTDASNATVKRLFKRISEYKCECGNLGQWLGKSLILQMDHINGNTSDCRLCNLRWLCPNCHSQTSTFAGKKIK